MSLAIQKQLNQEITSLTASDIELNWVEFVDKIAGDNDNLLAYLPLLKSIPAMDTPFELMVQFNTLRGQFANSEEKMANLLAGSEFIDGQDYCMIDVDNEKFTETLLFISYNCLKLFVMDKNDMSMTRAMILGEQMYNMYKDYSKKFAKAVPTPKTHYMIVEQKKIASKVLQTQVRDLGMPEKIILLIMGNAASMKKTMDDMKQNPSDWGDVIVPATTAIYASAKDDVKRIIDHINTSIIKPYKDNVRTRMKSKAKAENNKDIKAPASTIGWGCILRVSCIIVSSTNKTITFTHDDVVQSIKEYYINMLAQKHVSISKMSHSEYLECITELEAQREQNPGRFSAIRANAIYYNELLEAKKIEAKKDAKAKKEQNDSGDQDDTIEVHTEPTTNGYETNGSDAETESKPDPEPESKADSEPESKAEPTDAEKKKALAELKAKKEAKKKALAEAKAKKEAKEAKAKKEAAKAKKDAAKAKKDAKKTVETIPSSESDCAVSDISDSDAEDYNEDDDIVSDSELA